MRNLKGYLVFFFKFYVGIVDLEKFSSFSDE